MPSWITPSAEGKRFDARFFVAPALWDCAALALVVTTADGFDQDAERAVESRYPRREVVTAPRSQMNVSEISLKPPVENWLAL